MVIVTHEMSFARDVADRAIFMDQGRIVEQGPAKSLFANPQQPRTRQFWKNSLCSSIYVLICSRKFFWSKLFSLIALNGVLLFYPNRIILIHSTVNCASADIL